MGWSSSLSTHVWLFSVGRGIAGFIRTGLNQGLIIDAGSSDDFDTPAFIKEEFLKGLDKYQVVDSDGTKSSSKIAQVLMSHPHADHISYCKEFSRNMGLCPVLITCPHDKKPTDDSPVDEKFNWDHIEEPDDEPHSTYQDLYEKRSLPLQTIKFESDRTIPNLEYGIYYIPPPVVEDLHGDNDGQYVNGTSIMLYLRHGSHTILFPGDMTPEGMAKILADEDDIQKRYTVFDAEETEEHPDWHRETGDQPSLGNLLESRGLSILVAPHHGLASCFSDELFEIIKGGKPLLNIISDRRNKKNAKGELDDRYDEADYAVGLSVEIEGESSAEHSISTAEGHHILIVFSGTGKPKVYMDTDPENLLDILNQ